LINLIFIWFIVAYLRQQIECFPQILEGIGVLMQRVLLSLHLVAFLALLNGHNAEASSSESLLEDFQFLSKKSFSSTLNIGLYFQEPTTLNITLEGNPQEIHDGNLPYFTRTFGGDEAFLGELFGNFMLQITRGEHTQVLETFIQAKAAEGALNSEGDDAEEGETKISIDAGDIISFVLKTNFKFERLYASGGKRGTIKMTLQNQADTKPNSNWIAYPHPCFEAKQVGLQVLRTLFQKAHEVDSTEKSSHYFL